VSPETTVVWEWTGEGGAHNVVAEDESFESELLSEYGETFEYTFSEPGTVRYYCGPHKSLGMKGAVVVAEE
jgi:halocyanin-like protein